MERRKESIIRNICNGRSTIIAVKEGKKMFPSSIKECGQMR
jgi:hypothetical protein